MLGFDSCMHSTIWLNAAAIQRAYSCIVIRWVFSYNSLSSTDTTYGVLIRIYSETLCFAPAVQLC